MSSDLQKFPKNQPFSEGEMGKGFRPWLAHPINFFFVSYWFSTLHLHASLELIDQLQMGSVAKGSFATDIYIMNLTNFGLTLLDCITFLSHVVKTQYMHCRLILAFRNTLRHQHLVRRGQISNFWVDIELATL